MSKNRKRMIIAKKISEITNKFSLCLYVVTLILSIVFFSLVKTGSMSIFDVIIGIICVIVIISFLDFYFIAIPFLTINITCLFVMLFNKEKVLLEQGEYTQVYLNLKKNIKMTFKDEKFLDICNSKNVKFFAKPTDINKILVKAVNDDEEMFEILIYEDEFYYHELFEYEKN